MAPRLRKLIALMILLPGMTAYLVASAAIGERVPDVAVLKGLYYLAAGIAWAFPAHRLVKWANGSSQNGT